METEKDRERRVKERESVFIYSFDFLEVSIWIMFIQFEIKKRLNYWEKKIHYVTHLEWYNFKTSNYIMSHKLKWTLASLSSFSVHLVTIISWHYNIMFSWMLALCCWLVTAPKKQNVNERYNSFSHHVCGRCATSQISSDLSANTCWRCRVLPAHWYLSAGPSCNPRRPCGSAPRTHKPWPGVGGALGRMAAAPKLWVV